MILGTFRVVFGFVLAALAAGVVQVSFAVTPSELASSSPERLWQAAEWALVSATESAIFAAPFALIAILLAEWLGIRSFAYYGMIGILIATAGFAVLVTGRTPETAGLANSYAIAAFLSTGLIAGVVYWIFSGRRAGGRRITQRRSLARSEQADTRPSIPAAQLSIPSAPLKSTPESKSGSSVPSVGKTTPSAAEKPDTKA